MSRVTQIIERIRALAGDAAKVDAALGKSHGIDGNLGVRHDDPKAIARRYATNSAEAELEEYLHSIDLDTLRSIEAVMYSGRGDGSAPEVREQLFSKTRSKEDAVRTIVEKRSSFDSYFDRGLERAKADGIDLDTL